MIALAEKGHGQFRGAMRRDLGRRRYSRFGAHPPYAAPSEPNTAVAQLVEHWSPKPAVGGSIPSGPAEGQRSSRRYRLGDQDGALSRLKHGFESRYRYCGPVGSRPHRLSVRTALFQGAERGSTPLGAMRGAHEKWIVGAVAQLVRVPVCHTGGRGFEPRQPRRKARAVRRAVRSPQSIGSE